MQNTNTVDKDEYYGATKNQTLRYSDAVNKFLSQFLLDQFLINY